MRYRSGLQLIIMAILLTLTYIPSPLAWDICPKATELEKMRKGFESIKGWGDKKDQIAEYVVNHYKTPVHEWITHMIYGCNVGFEHCSNPVHPHRRASDAVIAGVRWNDNPPFQVDKATKERQESCRVETIHLPIGAECWARLYYDGLQGAKRAAKDSKVIYNGNSGDALLYRVNFGDMQFLHSMASIDGEPASETEAKIMAWAEFAYKVALGKIKPNTFLYECGIPYIQELFPKETKRGWTVQYLLTCNDLTYQPRHGPSGKTDTKNFEDLAFGTLLHMIEDSFCKSHVERRPPVGEKCKNHEEPNFYQPGKVVSFHAFAKQKLMEHGRQDNREAYLSQWYGTSETAVEVGVVVKDYYENRKDWDDLKKYLKCVFSLEKEDAKAGPGDY